MSKILVTGAKGQIGTDLVSALRERYGVARVVASDIHDAAAAAAGDSSYESVDVRDPERLRRVIERHEIDTVYHLASLLSATGEQSPGLCWEVNVDGLRNILNLASSHRLRVFWPSSIAVFGPATPKTNTPQETVLDPTTVYGITKVTGELLCRYAAREEGVDVRSVRYPGLISHNAPPGGGTTDYAVNVFYAAIEKGSFTSFVRGDTRLPMMYMPDAVRASLEIMDADPERITVRTSYNLSALSFSAEELAIEIQRRLPDFTWDYAPDYRQAIADSWPSLVDDSHAREDWGWRHHHDLASTVDDMLHHLARKLETRTPTT